MATIVGCRQLTKEGALRKTIELQLRIEVKCVLLCVCVSKLRPGWCCLQGEVFSYEPGDAVSVICPNPSNEVDLLLSRYIMAHLVGMCTLNRLLVYVQVRFDVMC